MLAARSAAATSCLRLSHFFCSEGDAGGTLLIGFLAQFRGRKECHILQGGNTLRREGPLYRACTAERKLWHIVRINEDPDDPKRSPRVDVQWARDQIAKYGRDNPWAGQRLRASRQTRSTR